MFRWRRGIVVSSALVGSGVKVGCVMSNEERNGDREGMGWDGNGTGEMEEGM